MVISNKIPTVYHHWTAPHKNGFVQRGIMVPRNYQVEGIKFMREHKRVLNADAPGLGKTLQATETAEKPAVVLCPTYLTEQWYEFLTANYPDDVVALANGTRKDREREIKEPADWLICNTQMLRSYLLPIVKTVIVDEAHILRNHSAAMTSVAHGYVQTAENIILLTATPIVREPDNLWSLLHMLDPKRFDSYWNFVDMYCTAQYTPWGNRIVGGKNSKRLGELLKEYGIRREYRDVKMALPKLIGDPSKGEGKVLVELSPDKKKLYDRIRDYYRDEENNPLQSAMEVIQTLRQFTMCDEKIAVIKDIIADNDDGRPIVIYAWYRDSVKRIAKALGEGAVEITGEISPNMRQRVAMDKKVKYRVATIASLSEGVDMSDARTIIFAEDDYTPGAMYQALSRVRRWSHDNTPIRAYYTVVKDTIDEIIHRTVTDRGATATEIMKEAIA